MKSYSSHTVPPAPFGISDGVPTSKTLQPQAQAQLKLGVRVTTTPVTSESSPTARQKLYTPQRARHESLTGLIGSIKFLPATLPRRKHRLPGAGPASGVKKTNLSMRNG